ncbi:hypothetical protein COO60DRAFT_876493 [Scenedesmus sp. NREL 46B-D3]|nr:hypothetical protein COO60DRAFT_876493 [Scenedesmus sp. NREL 46B-D3]
MQQAALAVLTQQQPQSAECAAEHHQQQQQQQQQEAAGAKDDLWDAEEAELPASICRTDGALSMPAAARMPAACMQASSSTSSSGAGGCSRLQQQLAEQHTLTQQLQQQLEIEQSQSSDISTMHSSPACSPSCVHAGLQRQGLLAVPPSCAWAEGSSSCATERGCVVGQQQNAACAAVMCHSAVGLAGGAGGSEGGADTRQQLLECRAALAAQHAACEELRQHNDQLLAALRQAGCST